MFGEEIRYTGEETTTSLGERLKAVACEAKGTKHQVDITVVHAPEAGMPAAKNGCTSIAISGHTHILSGPNLEYTDPAGESSYQLTEGTSGGAKEGAIPVGPLKKDAVETILFFDKKTHRPIDSITLTEHPDASVSLMPYTPMPQPLLDIHHSGITANSHAHS